MSTDPIEAFAQLARTLEPPQGVDGMRRQVEAFSPLLNADPPEVGAIHRGVEIAEGVTTDVIVPKGEGPHPVLVYFHGGGWICGSPATVHKLACRFAEAGTLVFNVAYRLAPEHPFPTPFEDSLAALRWAAREAPRWNGDPARLAVGGDSAGANLSAAAAAALADDPARPRAALLIYGIYDFATVRSAAAPEAQGPAAALGQEMVDLMVDSYLGSAGEALQRDPRASPVHAAERLPPCHVVVGGADPLVVQSEALVEALARVGVAHEHFVDAGMPHGYAQMEMLPPARHAIERMIAFLARSV